MRTETKLILAGFVAAALLAAGITFAQISGGGGFIAGSTGGGGGGGGAGGVNSTPGAGIQISGVAPNQVIGTAGVPTKHINLVTDEAAKCNVKTFNAGAMDNNVTANLTDTTNTPFVAGDVGKSICVEKTSASTTTRNGVAIHQSTCGTISTFTSSSVVVLSFNNVSTGAISSVSYSYGSLDDTPLANAVTAITAQGGGIIDVPGMCGVSNTVAWPTTVSMSIQCQTSPAVVVNGGAQISAGQSGFEVLTKAMGGGGNGLFSLDVAGGSTHSTSRDSILNCNLVASAGQVGDGAGKNAIDIQNWEYTTIANNNISNFSGAGIKENPGGTAVNDYLMQEVVYNNQITYSGADGIQFGPNAGGGGQAEMNRISFNVVHGSQNEGLDIGTVFQGAVVDNNVFQFNNQANTNPDYELNIKNAQKGLTIFGNHMEILGVTNTTCMNPNPSPTGTVAFQTGTMVFNNWCLDDTTILGMMGMQTSVNNFPSIYWYNSDSADANAGVTLALGQDSTHNLGINYYNAANSPANTGLIFTNTNSTGGLRLNTFAAAPIAFFTNNAEHMRLFSSGGLDVNTTPADPGVGVVDALNGYKVANTSVINSSAQVAAGALALQSSVALFYRQTPYAGNANATVSNTVANVWPAVGGGTAVATTSEGTVSQGVAVACTAKNMNCFLTNAAGTKTVAGGTNYVLAFRQNLASSALTCTIAAGASSCQDASHTVALSAASGGDQIDFIDTPSGTPTALIPHCSVECDI